jgi:hypothetical protein
LIAEFWLFCKFWHDERFVRSCKLFWISREDITRQRCWWCCSEWRTWLWFNVQNSFDEIERLNKWRKFLWKIQSRTREFEWDCCVLWWFSWVTTDETTW